MPAMSVASRELRACSTRHWRAWRPGELPDDVALGAGHGEGPPVGPAPLRDDGLDGNASAQQDSGRPVDDGPAPGGQDAAAAGAEPAGGVAPDDRQAGVPLPELAEELGRREGKGVTQEEEGARLEAEGLGPAREPPGVVGRRLASMVTSRQRAHPPRPQADGGGLLDLGAGGHHRLCRAAHRHQGMEGGVDGGGDVLEGAGVRAGDAQDDEVRAIAEGLEHGTRHLTDGLRGDGVEGEGAGERHAASPSLVGGPGEADVERAEVGVEPGVLDGHQAGGHVRTRCDGCARDRGASRTHRRLPVDPDGVDDASGRRRPRGRAR